MLPRFEKGIFNVSGFLQAMSSADISEWYKLAGGVPRICLKQAMGSREDFLKELQGKLSACNAKELQVLMILVVKAISLNSAPSKPLKGLHRSSQGNHHVKMSYFMVYSCSQTIFFPSDHMHWCWIAIAGRSYATAGACVMHTCLKA